MLVSSAGDALVAGFKVRAAGAAVERLLEPALQRLAEELAAGLAWERRDGVAPAWDGCSA